MIIRRVRCTLALLVLQLSIAPVIHVTPTSAHPSSSSSSSKSLHEIVRHTANNNHDNLHDRVQLSEIKFSKNRLVKLDSNLRSSQHQLSAAQIHPSLSRYHNQIISDQQLSSTSAKSSDIQQQQQQQEQIKRGLFDKICIGTSNKLSVTANKSEHYQNLVDRYRNCTYVIGNLEITWLDDEPGPDGVRRRLDMSFLESIREITGHLLIAKVNVERIRMPNLHIIRGRDLFLLKRNCEAMKCDDMNEKDEFAMLLMFNELKSLELPNLREILAGGVGSINNKNLCHLRTIHWDEILNSTYRTIFTYDMNGQPECPPCDKSCLGNCWAEGPDMCQKFSKAVCAPHCNQGRCFGSAPRECCHPSCAGGCTGPKQTDCLACKHFYNDGECAHECPPMQIYNPSKFSWEPNPKGKYAYGASCVKECPDYLVRDNGACVRTCPPNKRSSNGECLSCSGPGGNECHQGADNRAPGNCTPVEGSMSILEASFTGFADLLAGGDSRFPCNGQPESSSQSSSSTTAPTASAAPDAAINSPVASGTSVASQPTEASTSAGSASSNGTEVAASNRPGVDPFANCKAIINSTGQLSGGDSGWPQTAGLATPQCIKLDEPCPDGYYQEYAGSTGKPVCRRCHHRCQRCTGMGTHVSVCQCAAYVAGEQCEDFCPRDYFPDEQSRRCLRCSAECNGCSGPTEADCHTCRVYRIYLGAPASAEGPTIDSNNIEQLVAAADTQKTSSQRQPFNCTSQCPPEKPYRISESNLPDLYCSELPDINGDAALLASRIPSQTLAGLGTCLMLLSVLLSGVGICLWVRRLESEKNKTVKLTMHLSGIDDVEPLNPSNMKPNLAPLRSIKETDLRKGNELGSGFGGTVYQGLWHPEGREHKNPRPVAIKVLRDNGQSNMNKKFLDEAYIMASVNHPNLVKLLAVCMTPKHLMLVTPLMPLGCLLEHVKEHKLEISSKNLLEWSKQIAKGMAYLEEHRMVHRDLALRNVLLRICGRAMISDFGLAKFLELDQSEYHSLGGRLPVKWLAPECIRERRFTHKSDVWAFGVTVWELLTFGKRPFEEYNTWKDMLTAIENGARLEQPPYLTTEVYSVMLSCWFYKPEARPSFRQLTQDFVKFARDPLRYVAIGAKGIDYDPASPSSPTSGRFARMSAAFATGSPTRSRARCRPSSQPIEAMQQQQHHHQRHQLDSDQDEYSADSDLEQSQVSSSSLAGDEPEPQTPQQLLATSELTPSTHNRINESTIRFGFDFGNRRARQPHSSMSECSDTPLKTPTTPLKRMHFAVDQQLIEEVDYDDIDVFKVTTKRQQQQLDGNNNFITVPSAGPDSWQHLTTGGSLSRAHNEGSSEQPTDMYDYLLPSPCTEGDTHNFSQLYATTGDALDAIDGPAADQQQALLDKDKQPASGTGIRSLSVSSHQTPSTLGGSGGQQQQQQQARCGGSTLPSHQHRQQQQQLNHHLSSSMVGVNNYEYFITRASSQYLSGGGGATNNQHYADMDPSSAAAAANRQLQHSQQHLSTSNGNIPHSLV